MSQASFIFSAATSPFSITSGNSLLGLSLPDGVAQGLSACSAHGQTLVLAVPEAVDSPSVLAALVAPCRLGSLFGCIERHTSSASNSHSLCPVAPYNTRKLPPSSHMLSQTPETWRLQGVPFRSEPLPARDAGQLSLPHQFIHLCCFIFPQLIYKKAQTFR